MIKTWERYFLKEIIQMLVLLLASFWGLYVIIDYATRTAVFKTFQFTNWEIVEYYTFMFLKRLEILLPFAFLIASVRTLTKLNIQSELVAMMASGVPLKRLIRPFIYLSLFLTMLGYLNLEWTYPKAMAHLHRLEDSRTSDQYKRAHNKHVESLLLEDGSTLLFNHLDTAHNIIKDAFWVRSIDEVYLIKTLRLFDPNPNGEWIEILKRDEQGALVHHAQHEKMEFPDMRVGDRDTAIQLHRPQEQSISTLLQLKGTRASKEGLLKSALAHKLLIPWLPLLVFLAVAPSCLIFSRNPSTFYIYVIGMFSLLCFYLVLNAGTILSQHQVMSSLWTLVVPMLAITTVAGWRYKRLLRRY